MSISEAFSWVVSLLLYVVGAGIALVIVTLVTALIVAGIRSVIGGGE